MLFMCWLVWPLREQARSQRELHWGLRHSVKTVGAGLLAKAICQALV